MLKTARHMLCARLFSRALHAANILIFHTDHLGHGSSKQIENTGRTTPQARRTIRAPHTTQVLCGSHTHSTLTMTPDTLAILPAKGASYRSSLAGHGAWRAVHAIIRVGWLTVHSIGTSVIGAAAWTLGWHMITWEDVSLSIGRGMDRHAFHASDMFANAIANSLSEQIRMGSGECEQLVVARVVARWFSTRYL